MMIYSNRSVNRNITAVQEEMYQFNDQLKLLSWHEEIHAILEDEEEKKKESDEWINMMDEQVQLQKKGPHLAKEC